MTQHTQQQHELSRLKVYHARVLRTERKTPLMQRVTLGELDAPTFESRGPDQFVLVFFPKPEARHEPPVGHDFTREAFLDLPPEQRPVGRYYTVRHHRPEVAEIDLDMVLHGEGPGATFAKEATPGDAVSLWGPRICYQPPEGPPFLLLLADLTGLPAMASILASLPAGQKAHAFIEVPDASEQQSMPTQADARVTWVHRGAEPAGKSEVLIDAVCRAELPEHGIYAYGAGEYGVMRQLRRHLREERRLPKEAVNLINYWRHEDHPFERDDE
jgi:NADPH-dependent ferric siderophore reductase